MARHLSLRRLRRLRRHRRPLRWLAIAAAAVGVAMVVKVCEANQVDCEATDGDGQEQRVVIDERRLEEAVASLANDRRGDQQQEQRVHQSAQRVIACESKRMRGGGRMAGGRLPKQADCKGHAIEQHVGSVGRERERTLRQTVSNQW